MARRQRAPKPVTGAFYWVYDARALARLVQAFVKEATVGTQVAAAKRLGVSQGTVSKLRSGKVEKLGSDTYARLACRLPAEELRRAVLAPEQVARLRQWAGWLGHELRGYTAAPSVGVVTLPDGTVHALVPGPSEELDDPEPEVYGPFRVRRQYRLLDESVAGAVKRLREDRRYAGYFKSVKEAAVRRWGTGAPEREYRLALAEYRMVEPLLRGRVSGGVERTLTELQASGELAVYLAAAARAQRILLQRPSAHERALQQSRRRRERRRAP